MSARGIDCFHAYREIIPDYHGFIDALHEPAPMVLRINTLLADPENVIHRLRARDISLEPTVLGGTFWSAPDLRSPGHLLEHMMGLVYTQSLGSGIPVLALDPRPNEIVLDMCAAPGSKTTQMAQHMENTGCIVANDPICARHASLQSNLRRLSVSNALVTAYDGRSFPMKMRFSKILVDAPCSGEGVGRINASGRLEGVRPVRRDLSRLQRAILLRAFDVLNEDGTLVYATCTYNPAENEAVVDDLLKSRPARLLDIDLSIPHDRGIAGWNGVRYHGDIEKAWRIYPHRLQTTGFFLAKVGHR